MGQYQHNLTDWPHFTWDERAILSPLCLAHRRIGALVERLASLGEEIRADAALESMTGEAVHSSAIEGEQLSPDLVRSSMAQRLGLAASSAAQSGTAAREDGGAAFLPGKWRVGGMEVVSDLALARLEGGEARYLGMSARIRQKRNDYYSILERTQSGSSLILLLRQ